MSTESEMIDFDRTHFKAENYVKDLVQECVGGSALQQRKITIQSYSDQTSSLLKKHVYANYMQFIDTAKEISHLESEMYQLSHLLIEQRNILSTLRDESSATTSTEVNSNALKASTSANDHDDDDKLTNTNQQQQQQNKRVIEAIKESVIGFNSNTILEQKTFIHEGAVIELDTDNYRPICRLYLFLFNDLLIITKIKHDKKLEFVKQYDASKLAVINIRDLDGVKNAINAITPDGSKIFQCVNAVTKTDWIDKFEIALKFNQYQKNKSQAITKSTPPPSSKPQIFTMQLQQQQSQIDTKSIGSDVMLTPISNELLIPMPADWIVTAPEELQALIAQRHFEDGFSLILKCEEYFTRYSTFYNAVETINKIASLKSTLSYVLLMELGNYQSRSLQAALRYSKRPLKLLCKMGKARSACGTILKVCTTAIRSSQRQARRNNLDISELFFCDLAQVSSEFLTAFNKHTACISTLVVWCNIELQYFASQCIKHYLTKGTSLQVVAKFVDGIRIPCAKLTDIGLDLSYHMDGLLRNALEQIIEESRVRLVDTIGRTEEIWQPYNLQSKSNLRITLKDLEALGINMKSHVTGDTWINLTQSTVAFCRHFLTVTNSCGILAKNETLKGNVEKLLKELFMAQYNVKPSETLSVDLNFVPHNKTYLSEQLLPIAIANFEKQSNSKSELLPELLCQLRAIPPTPKPRSIYQTAVI